MTSGTRAPRPELRLDIRPAGTPDSSQHQEMDKYPSDWIRIQGIGLVTLVSISTHAFTGSLNSNPNDTSTTTIAARTRRVKRKDPGGPAETALLAEQMEGTQKGDGQSHTVEEPDEPEVRISNVRWRIRRARTRQGMKIDGDYTDRNNRTEFKDNV